MPAVVEMSSTPHGAMDSSSASDKKRNKLGYHRTSVACVHCRRRKIRCLVAADDAHGRCENCIRLRKECQFFPVDQQPPIEKKPRPSSRLETLSAASPSPPILSGRLDPSHPHPHPMQATLPSTTTTAAAAVAGVAGVVGPGGGPPAPPPSQQLPTQPQTASEPFFSPYHGMPMTTSQELSFAPGGFGGVISPFADGSNMAEFAPPPTSLDPSLPWDEFTTISDPQMLASMNAAAAAAANTPNSTTNTTTTVKPSPSMMSNHLSPTTVWTNNPEQTPLPTTPTVLPSQPQQPGSTLNAPPTTFTLQPDGSVWPMHAASPHNHAPSHPQSSQPSPAAAQHPHQTHPPTPSTAGSVPPSMPPRSMTFPTHHHQQQPEMGSPSSYPDMSKTQQQQQHPHQTHMATSTSPNPNAQSFPGTPVHGHPHLQHSPDPMQMPMSMSYPGHHPHPHPHQHPGGATMGFPAWPDAPGGLGIGVGGVGVGVGVGVGMNMVMPYGMFGDASSPPPPPPPPS